MNRPLRYIPRYLPILFFAAISSLKAQLVVNTSVTAAQMVNEIVGQGVTVSNVQMNCPAGAYGKFNNGNTTNIGLNQGVILTTGSATSAIGPNTIGSQSTCNGTSFSDPQLTTIEPLATNDPCILEFDFIPTCDSLKVRYVFGSEEYPEFVNAGFNDAFGIFLTGQSCSGPNYNGTNIALIPNTSTPVSIDNVNAGNNSTYYVDNTGGLTIQYDGFTVMLSTNVCLKACTSYHIKFAIADAGDCVYDSGIFIDSASISCNVPPLVLSTNSTNTTCGNSTGTATVNVTGGSTPYTYTWNPSGQTTQTATGLGAGTYTVVVTATNGCFTASATVNILNSNGPNATSAQTNVVCNGGLTGTATANASGGTTPYTYSWNPSGQTGQTATGLGAGTYTCTVTDQNGCTFSFAVTITQPTALALSSTVTNTTCSNSCNGSVMCNVSGGTSGYTYLWNNGQTAQTATGLCTGTYTVTVTDANSCTATATATVASPPPVTASTSQNNLLCATQCIGTATVTVGGGTTPYTYAWSNFQTSATATGLCAGSYTVIVSDVNGCTNTATVTITAPAPINLSAVVSNPTICVGQSSTLTATASGGSSPYTYTWTPGNMTGSPIVVSPTVTTTYTVVVTDQGGCTNSSTALVSVNAPLVVSASGFIPICPGNCANISANGTGGSTPYTYTWNPGNLTGAFVTVCPTVNTTYTVTLTDACGSVPKTDTLTVFIRPLPNVIFSASPVTGCQTLCVTFTDQTQGGCVNQVWTYGDGTPPQTTNTPSHCYNVPGTYSVAMVCTDQYGCVNSDTLFNYITVNPVPNAVFTTNPASTVYFPGQICMTDASTGGVTTWAWTINGMPQSTSQNFCYTIPAVGQYCIDLLVTTGAGCIDTVSKCIDAVLENFTYFVPNVFTPNSDGSNNIFFIKNSGVSALKCSIYDRWGLLIYEWNDPKGGWDGKTKSGKVAPDGVYYYVATITRASNNEVTEVNGFLHLLGGQR